ncbi:MAG: hypothetical protein KDH17_12630 [Rhodocyclaceae bacterium]|nr:hypothetical protein [Rhodocyclaceae bacterium]
MDSILNWLTKYSPPIVLLIAFFAVLIFLFKNIIEKAISAQFDQYKKEVDLRLQRRSNFEERVLLDRYILVRDIQARIGRVMTDLNRTKSGTKVEGLMRDGDIVPLTEVFELLANNRYLLTERFHKILNAGAQLAMKYANARDPEAIQNIQSEYLGLLDSFHQSMHEVFGIDKITWKTR